MLIDIANIAETVIPHFRGGEGSTVARMFVDPGAIKVLHGYLDPGCSIGLHTHETSSEVVCIVSGRGVSHYDGAVEDLGPGSVHYCPKGHEHDLVNTGSERLVFFAVVPEQ